MMETRLFPEPEPISPHAKEAELKRILASKYFARAPKRRLFLEFTSDHALRGEGDKLNEYLVGVEVYERGTEFDPHQDPIVRVQAYEIRRALKTYYEAEGKNNPLRVELPLGQYAPLFTRAKTETGTSLAPPIPEEPRAEAGSPASAHWQIILLVCLGLACAALGLLFARERTISRRPIAASTLPEPDQWLWKPFFSTASQPLVVVSSSPTLRLVAGQENAKILADAYEIPKSKLPQFRDTPHFRELKSFSFVPSTADYTGIGEALGLASLLKLFASHGSMIRVKPSRLADYREIQSSNTILLGGANQWTNRVLHASQHFSTSLAEGVITNANPRADEQAVYAPKFDPATGELVRDYALIVMLPNHAKEKRVLRLDGLYTQGTEAAAEYVSSVEGLGELHKALLSASRDRKSLPLSFEALLSVPVENHVPGGASLVAVRVIAE